MSKKITILFIIFTITVALSSCKPLSDNLSKDEIFTLAKQNQDLLNNAVTEINSSKLNIVGVSTTQKSEISNSDYLNIKGLYIVTKGNIYRESDDIIFKSVMELKGLNEITVEGDIVNFSCGGAGLGSSTSYYGFYYTKNENLTAIWCCGGAVVPDGKGWSWKESDGDNSYYTEKICDNFYYYEAHF